MNCKASFLLLASFCYLGSPQLLECLAETAAAEYSSNLILPSHRWLGSDGNPLPFKNDEEIIDFLRTAEVLKVEKIPEGVTKPQKVYLEKGGIRAAAVFRYKEIHKDRWNDPNAGPRLNFRDSCVYECAAYRLSRLVGLNNIPAAVRRKIKGRNGTVQLWIEGAMTDTNRLKDKIIPPDSWRWARQDQVMKLWDELIYNDDRNKGNVLIDKDWNVWLIDHTRAFRVYDDIPKAKEIRYCERGIWEKLKGLDEELVETELDDYLRSTEIEGLLKRRERLIAHIQGLIEEKGEKAVLFDFRSAKQQ